MSRRFFISGFLNLSDDDEACKHSFDEIKADVLDGLIEIPQLDEVRIEER